MLTGLLTMTPFARSVNAQSAGQPVTGTVLDPTGAVLPTAQVELRTGTGTVVASTMADGAGVFRLDLVAPGRYDVVVTFEGFQPTTVHVTVANRAPASLRITLPLAAITQEVTV